MTRQRFRAMWLWVALGLLMLSYWTLGTVSHWALRLGVGFVGGLAFVELSWLRRQ